ncbi:MAG: anaerobic ribonucleoside-triphosphate reductase activating protein [Thermoanaerobacterium sp.]|jgi:anaerobic ribonucleoside-triphosphate reductase activating protein|nr:anaerobic ribonucleoside-triphosphate reductase activating protein [Thermoanaerobacterium sp.]
MNILSTQYSLETKSLEIYVAGCSGNPHCANCHNHESWDFKQGTKYNEKYFSHIKNKIKDFDALIDNIMILGGEPLDQNIDELIHLLFDLNTLNKKIWLFTRYEIEQIPNEVIKFCDYIKTGKYIPELKTDNNIQYGIKLATSNQKIIKCR